MELTQAISRFEQHMFEKSSLITSLEATLDTVFQSRSWRLTAPLRHISTAFRQFAKKLLLQRFCQVYQQEGALGVMHRLRHKLVSRKPKTETNIETDQTGTKPDTYARWLETEGEELKRLRQETKVIGDGTNAIKFSILVPLHNTPPTMLLAMAHSVFAQIYPNWELCLCNDASTAPETRSALQEILQSEAGLSQKIRLHERTENGHIAAATNDAFAQATGDYVVLLDHDDELAPHALLRLAEEIAKNPTVDFIYSDEDKLNEEGQRCDPFFKPDCSPALLWSQNYIGHLMCIRHDLMQQLGGMKIGSQGSQDHDLALRLIANTDKVRHLPEILYHWRMHAGSVTVCPTGKPYAHEAGKRAVAEALAEKYPQHFLRVDDLNYLFVYEPRFKLPENCLISIIIPTKDKIELLRPCIASIRERSSWENYEIIILDNNSCEPATSAYLQSLIQQDANIRVLPAPIPFNWSKLNNLAAAQAKGEVLVFLNNDTTVITKDWLERLAEVALLPDVATVGAQLLYPDKTLQHAGVVVGMGQWADHVFKGQRPEHRIGPFVSNTVTRNVLANTGACLAIARQQFERLGGFDELFEICGSDVEIGIRAHNLGLQNLYLATVQLYHFESKTRSAYIPEQDFIQSELKYAPYRLGGDPFYNPNLDLANPVPTIRQPATNA